MKVKVYLTRTGLLVQTETVSYFCSNSGFLRRLAIDEEVEYISTISPSPEITLIDDSFLPHNKEDFAKNTLEISEIDTVYILKSIDIDYFSYENSGLTPLNKTEYADIYNQWLSVSGNGADYRIELAKRKNNEIVVIVVDYTTQNDDSIIGIFPFTKQGIQEAIEEMYSQDT